LERAVAEGAGERGNSVGGSRRSLVDSLVFQNIENEDLHKILCYVIAAAATVIDSQDEFAEEDRIKISDRLLSYKK